MHRFMNDYEKAMSLGREGLVRQEWDEAEFWFEIALWLSQSPKQWLSSHTHLELARRKGIRPFKPRSNIVQGFTAPTDDWF